MVGASVGLGKDGQDILEGLPRLSYEIGGLEAAVLVPTDLAADKDEASRRGYPLAIALGARPFRGLKDLHRLVLKGHKVVVAPFARFRSSCALPLRYCGGQTISE